MCILGHNFDDNIVSIVVEKVVAAFLLCGGEWHIGCNTCWSAWFGAILTWLRCLCSHDLLVLNRRGKYTLLHVKMEYVTTKLHFSLELDHAALDCRLQGFLPVPRFAISQSDVVCLFTRIKRGLWPPKSHDCLIYTCCAMQDRTSGQVGLKKS
jgi:hypothetical protein